MDVNDEELYRNIVESAGDIVAMIDRSSGLVSYVNPSVQRILGYPPKALIGRPVSSLAVPGQAASAVLALDERARAFEAGDGSKQSAVDRLEMLALDGTVVALELATTLLAGADGRVVSVVAIARDVSRRAGPEADARRSLDSPATRRVVHDLNNLLTATLGYAAFALKRLPPDHPATADVRELQGAALEAAELVRVHLARVEER